MTNLRSVDPCSVELAASDDGSIVCELAKQVAQIAARDVQEKRRELWTKHNNFERVNPPLYMRVFACYSETVQPWLQCEDEFYRGHEKFLRAMIHQDWLGDDFIVEPWITQRAVTILPSSHGDWGLDVEITSSQQERGAYVWKPPLAKLDDLRGLVEPRHEIDEQETERRAERLHDAIGDTLEINVQRRPYWHGWISKDLATLRGLEELMFDMIDDPENLHKLMKFLSDGIIKAFMEAEKAGDWHLSDHENQSMPYAAELERPCANSEPVKLSDLWYQSAAQELTLVSPAMHREFMLDYEKPIMEMFGVSAYGCCEDLGRKIDILRDIKNLRRIAISPMADVRACAEQIGSDYICSYRPSPADTVCRAFNADRVHEILRKDIETFRQSNCFFDVCLKDVETVENDPMRLKEFVRICREETENYLT